MPGHIGAAQQEEEVREKGHAPPPAQVPAAQTPLLQALGREVGGVCSNQLLRFRLLVNSFSATYK